MNPRRALISMAAATLVGTSLSPAEGSVTPIAAPLPELNIAVLGDSYASGEGAIGPGGWMPSEWPDCHRSSLSGPFRAAQRVEAVRVGRGGRASVDFLACSGASTDGLNASSRPFGKAGRSLIGDQIPRLRPGTDLITLSIGGNDAGFSLAIDACLDHRSIPRELIELIFGPDPRALQFNPALPVVDPPLPPCQLNAAFTDTVAVSLADLGNKLSTAYRAIPGNPRNAVHVLVSGYPDPTTGSGGYRCGEWNLIPQPPLDRIGLSEAGWLSVNFIKPLNSIIRSTVEAVNRERGKPSDGHKGVYFHFLESTPGMFHTHGYCVGGATLSPDPAVHAQPRYVATPADSFFSQWDFLGTLHPNDRGHWEILSAFYGSMLHIINAVPEACRDLAKQVDFLDKAIDEKQQELKGATTPGEKAALIREIRDLQEERKPIKVKLDQCVAQYPWPAE